MDQSNNPIIEEIRYHIVRPIGERVSVLETQQTEMDGKLDAITEKLDELLTLKAKGLGAIGLVSILFASIAGIAGLLASFFGIFGQH